ncbi:MAG: arylsulfatase family protein [Verrucomicrobiales bacterium]|nr:arylsulfatase family protein [Verrucomicrobiales bacterium]
MMLKNALRHPARSLRRAPAVLLLAFYAPFHAGAAEPGQPAKKPNILLIVADDLGYGETGFQGFTKDIPTPHLDSIARNGTRFTSGYVSGPYCSPTRAALLTGRYQQRFGHEFNPGPPETAGQSVGLPLEEKTIGDRLRAAGYTTGWFGKSHLGNTPEYHPLKRGFDTFYGFLGGAHSYLKTGGGPNAVLRGTEPVKESGYLTETFARETVDFIGTRKDQPWFVYLAFNAVHSPLETTEKYESRFAHIKDGKRRKFAALLSALDDAAGSVLTKVRELGQEENTLVFFISDNGGPTAQITSGNGPLRGFKAQTWEGGVRVPFAVQWKGHIPAGKTDPRPVIQLDILPTALAAAGLEKPEKADGVNLLPFLTGEKTEAPHEALYWRFGRQLAVRKGDWKLVKAPEGGGLDGQNNAAGTATVEGAQLYNLTEDIGEKNNLAVREPEKVKELSALWNQWNSGLVSPKWRPGAGRNNKNQDRTDPDAAAPTTAGSAGPWKAGDALDGKAAPQVAGRALRLSADIEANAPDGVIVAQGAKGNGYALYLHGGRLALAVRAASRLSTVVSTEALPSGKRKVAAELAADGVVTLIVDGKKTGAGKLPDLIAHQPGEGLTVGGDGRGAVGDYEAPNTFKGTVENVTVELR